MATGSAGAADCFVVGGARKVVVWPVCRQAQGLDGFVSRQAHCWGARLASSAAAPLSSEPASCPAAHPSTFISTLHCPPAVSKDVTDFYADPRALALFQHHIWVLVHGDRCEGQGGGPAWSGWACLALRGRRAKGGAPRLKTHLRTARTPPAQTHRTNPFTGVAYKDEPAILGWSLFNEPRCPGAPWGWKGEGEGRVGRGGAPTLGEVWNVAAG